MAFKKGESGNPRGRPTGTKQSARRLGANQFKRLLRAIEPYADEGISVAAEIMRDEEASSATRLKAAMMLLQKYTELTGEVYFNQLPKEEESGKKTDDADETDDEEEQSQKGNLALFSKKAK